MSKSKPHTWFFDPFRELYICFPHKLGDSFCYGCGKVLEADDLGTVLTSEIPVSVLSGKTPAGAILATLDYLIDQKQEETGDVQSN